MPVEGNSEQQQLPQQSGTIEYSPLLHAAVSDVDNTDTDILTSSKRSLDAGVTWVCLASALMVCISPLQYGYHIAELNIPKRSITSCDEGASRHWSTLPLCLPMNDTMYSIATSIFAIGGLLGSLLAGWMADRWGRRGALVYNNVFYLVGPLLMAFAVSPIMLTAGRFVSGVGSGAAIVIAPLYLSEIAPVKYRGTLNLLNQLSIVLGVLITLIVGMVANKGPYWRISVGFGLVLASLHLSVAAFAVESPRYLWSNSRRIEARNVLRKLRNTSNVDDEVAEWPSLPAASNMSTDNYDELRSSAEHYLNPSYSERHNNETDTLVTIFNIFMFAQYRKSWLLVLLLQFGQQLSGINSVFYYSSSVLEKMFSSEVCSTLTVLIGVLNVLATASAALIVDRFGRRPLLFSSMAAMAVSLVLLGIGLSLQLNVLAATSLYLVVASFAPGYGPVPFLLGTEFFDVRAAGAGGSWALAANWAGSFLVAVAFLPLQHLIGQWVFAIFVGSLLVCGAVFYIYIPETKGRTIEEIAAKLK